MTWCITSPLSRLNYSKPLLFLKFRIPKIQKMNFINWFFINYSKPLSIFIFQIQPLTTFQGMLSKVDILTPGYVRHTMHPIHVLCKTCRNHTICHITQLLFPYGLFWFQITYVSWDFHAESCNLPIQFI